MYGPIKFLHVIRDGRDVALSANTSPVDKFFDYFYPDAAQRRNQFDNGETKEALAMQLWNDWNIQAMQWERKHSDEKTFNFLAV